MKGFGKISLLTAATGLTIGAAENIRTKTDKTSQDINRQVAILKKKINSMESNQKNLVKALCVITAFSTGVDLTLLA